MVVVVGTNNIRVLDKIIINLSSLAKDMFKYVHSLVTKHTSLQVFLPVVLPICADNSPINTRIQALLKQTLINLSKIFILSQNTLAIIKIP